MDWWAQHPYRRPNSQTVRTQAVSILDLCSIWMDGLIPFVSDLIRFDPFDSKIRHRIKVWYTFMRVKSTQRYYHSHTNQLFAESFDLVTLNYKEKRQRIACYTIISIKQICLSVDIIIAHILRWCYDNTSLFLLGLRMQSVRTFSIHTERIFARLVANATRQSQKYTSLMVIT